MGKQPLIILNSCWFFHIAIRVAMTFLPQAIELMHLRFPHLFDCWRPKAPLLFLFLSFPLSFHPFPFAKHHVLQPVIFEFLLTRLSFGTFQVTGEVFSVFDLFWSFGEQVRRVY